MRELPEYPRLPDPRLSDECHDLTRPSPRAVERRVDLLELAGPADECREATTGQRLEARPCRTGSGQFIELDRLAEALHVYRAQWGDQHEALGESRRCRGEENRPWRRSLLGARGEVCRLPHCRVVHVQVV